MSGNPTASRETSIFQERPVNRYLRLEPAVKIALHGKKSSDGVPHPMSPYVTYRRTEAVEFVEAETTLHIASGDFMQQIQQMTRLPQGDPLIPALHEVVVPIITVLHQHIAVQPDSSNSQDTLYRDNNIHNALGRLSRIVLDRPSLATYGSNLNTGDFAALVELERIPPQTSGAQPHFDDLQSIANPYINNQSLSAQPPWLSLGESSQVSADFDTSDLSARAGFPSNLSAAPPENAWADLPATPSIILSNSASDTSTFLLLDEHSEGAWYRNEPSEELRDPNGYNGTDTSGSSGSLPN
ncbi:hypothetical protein GQ53DRAFT_803817 [Thozetella sp. PMI_491]|nr:hypothetical protein GQ53DRAFT_803817 [Thozetella sp. PMI_491]